MSFLLIMGWLVILGVSTIPVFLYIMFGSICNTEVYGKNSEKIDYVFELRHYGKVLYSLKLIKCIMM